MPILQQNRPKARFRVLGRFSGGLQSGKQKKTLLRRPCAELRLRRIFPARGFVRRIAWHSDSACGAFAFGCGAVSCMGPRDAAFLLRQCHYLSASSLSASEGAPECEYPNSLIRSKKKNQTKCVSSGFFAPKGAGFDKSSRKKAAAYVGHAVHS